LVQRIRQVNENFEISKEGDEDILGTQYASRVSEQYPARGKISLEIIKDLYQMATDLLKLFGQKNGCFPNKIIFYRDGKVLFEKIDHSLVWFRCR
jgi:hypothetical protein